MAETYDIAPYDPTVKQDEELFDSAKETDPQNEFPIGEPTAGFTPSPTPVVPERQPFPAPIPPPDPLPFLDEKYESAPSEEELRDAWVKLQPNGGLNPETATKYGDVLRRGAEAEKNEKLAKQKEDFKGRYRTPDGVLEMAKDPAVRREMDASPDDDLVIKRALNRSYLATTYGKPNASPEELDQIMRAHSILHWGINNPSHDTFYSKTREDVLKSDEAEPVRQSLITTVAQTILEDQLAGKQSSFSETFEKFATTNSKVITAQNKDEWYMTALLMDERLRKLGENVRFPAASIIDLSNKVSAGTATELDYDRATNALRGVNPKDLTQIMKVAGLAVREKDPKGEGISTVMTNIGKRFDREFNLTKVYTRYKDNLIGQQLENLKRGMVVGKDVHGRLAFAQPGQPLPPGVTQLPDEEYKAYWNDVTRAQDAIQIAREIQRFQEQVVDPVVPVFEGGLLGAAEAGVYDIAGFSKLIPLAIISSPLGGVATYTMVSASTYHNVRLENPNLDQQAANDWANLDGLINAVGMKFKGDFLLGHYPIFKTMRQLKGAGKTTEALMLYGRWAAVHNIEEQFEELAQDTLSASLVKLYGDAYPTSMKQQTWGDMLVDIARTRPQVAMAVGPLSLIGAGHATVRDLRNPMRDFMNPDALKSVGLKDEAVAEILASKDLDGAEKLFRQHYNTLTKEDLKRGFDYAAGLTEKAEVDEAMADPAMPTIDPVVMPDGTYKYNVLAPDGTVLSTHTDPDVAETAWVRETERVKGENWAAEQNATAQQAAAEAAAAASDEGVAKEAEARATAETVSPEDRLGTAMTVEFEENAAPTPEESREVAQLQADVAAQGRADVIVLARPSDAQAGPGQASLNFVRAFEAATGKRVVFVATGSDQPLSFTGAVRKGDPNTIFLDAHGDRNVLALVGHEWSHTLEKTSPELHAEMVGRMKPLIIEWAKQEGVLAAEVGPEGVTNEMVANIVGDAISNENFWTVMAQKDPGLFVKVRDAVLKFLNQFIGKVQKSEFGTEAFIKDATQMRDVVADIMHRAGQGAEAATAEAGVSFAPSLTKAQTNALNKLRFMQPFNVIVSKSGNRIIETGLNTATVHSLRDKGLIKASQIYLSGIVSEDLELPPEGQVSFAPRGTFPAPKVEADQTYINALREDRRPLWGMARNLPKGTKVGVRIDIPAFLSKGVYVQTIHEPKTGGEKGSVGKVIGYDGMVTIDNPVFWAHEKAAQAIQTGKTTKIPIATVEGNFDPSRTIPRGIVMGWAPVGFNPHKHSYFYDKETGDLVEGGEKAISIGNTVYVKNPIYGDKSKALFAGRKGQQKMAGAKGEREVAGKGYIEKAEIAQIAIDAEKAMEGMDEKKIAAAGGRDKMLAEIKRQVRTDVLAQRIKFPDGKVGDVKSPWSPIVYKGIVFEARETAPGFKAIAAWDKEPYSYEEPPEGVSREEWVNTLAKRSTQQFIERLQKGFGKGASQKAQENAQTILDSIEWYRDFVELVRGEWGGFSDLMADFLGAFSPNQNVRQNWRNAVDAIYGLSHGKYDQLFTEMDAWIKSGKTIKDWRAANKPLMRAKSGALFGTNTELGHLAALDMWRAIKRGDAPKAKNFTRNLIGLSIRATIDLWAARLLQRVAEKPRVAGVAKMGIKGAHVLPKKGQEGMPIEESVSGQFKFGQDVMAVVADQLKDPATWEGTGIDGSLFRYVTPADVQAMNWFVEKEIWWDNGWTNDEGSGGSMIYELNQERSSRFVAGLSQEISYREGHADYIPQHPEQAAFTRDIWSALRKSYPDALAIRVMDSIGSFMGGRERSTDLEMVHGPGMDPDAMMKEILYQAYAKDQSAAFISRVMKPGEADEDGNARPGLEFYFQERVTREQMEPVLAFLRSRGIDGFTLIVDRRTSPDPEGGPNEFWGARLQYIPEFTGDENWKETAVRYREAMKIAIRMVDRMQGVAYVGVIRYDTLVLQKGLHYDDNGIYPGALSGSESRAWRRRSIDATAEEATGLAEQAEGPVAAEPLPSGEPSQGRRGRPPPTGQVAFAGRRAAAVAAETAARMVEPEGRIALFQKMQNRVLALIAKHEAGFLGGQKRISLIQAIAEYNAMLKVLPPEIRGRVGQYGELARIGRSEEALAEFFTRAIARIDEVLERQLKQEYREQIEALLKDARPKKGPSGVVKSRVGPDAQALVARVLPYTEKSGEDVEARANQIELTLGDSTQTDKLSPEQISALVIEQEELNQYGALKEQSAESLAATHAALKQTLRSGRSTLSAKEETRLADQRAKAVEITRRLPAASQSGIKAKNQKVLKNFFSNFLRSHYSLAQMLGQVIPNASFLEEWQEVSRRQTMADYDFVLNTTTELSKLVRQALGKNSSVAAGSALAKMKELTIVGPKGKVSKLDAIHYVMAWKQRDVQTRMEEQGWTKEHIDAFNAELSDPVSQALMKFFRQKYDLIYQKANVVYRRMYGMDLPKNPNYVPMRYEHGALELESDPTGGPLAISGLTPSAIKGRVAHDSEMQQVDALDVFLQHLNQMSHWLHTAELNREMRGVLTNVEAKKSLKQHLGQDGYQMVLNQMDAIARNGSARAGDVKAVTQVISFVSAGKAITALAFNLHSLVMQFDSAMRFMLAIPASRWVPLLANPKSWANFSTAWHSDTVQRRIIGGMAPDVQFAMQANNLTPSSLLALTRAGMLPINYADAFATSVSSAIVYTDAINQGASHEVALDRMDAAVARFSQPTVLASKSGMEVTSSAALKLFMMFMSDARLKTGILWEAIGDIRNGKNIGMAIQRILVVEAMSLLGQLIVSAYAYMLSDDDDEQEWYGDLNGYLRALFAAPLQGLIFVGSIAEATASWVFGIKMFPKTDPFTDLANKSRKAIKHLPDITRPFEDPSAFLKEIDNLARATGSVSGPMAGLPAAVGQAARWAGEAIED